MWQTFMDDKGQVRYASIPQIAYLFMSLEGTVRAPLHLHFSFGFYKESMKHKKQKQKNKNKILYSGSKN